MSAARVRAAGGARLLVAAALAAVLAGCPQPEEQQPPPQDRQPAVKAGPAVPGRVAVVISNDIAAYRAPVEPFKTTLGREVNVFDLAGAKPGTAEGRAVMDRVVQSKPPLVLVVGGAALDLARERAPGVPIVFTMVINWAHHGIAGAANVTGVAFEVPPEVQFTQLKIVAPAIKTVGVIHSAATQEVVERARKIAGNVGVRVRDVVVAAPADVRKAWPTLQGKVDALWMIPDPQAVDAAAFTFLKDAALGAKIPFVGASDKFVEAGCLMALSPDYESIGSQAAILADRILDGELKAKLDTVQAPVGTILTINLQTARAIGLTIDEAVLDLADQVIGAPEDGGDG